MQFPQQPQGLRRATGESSFESAAKRQKVRVACQECRDRKIRCDGGRPICNSCLRKNLPPDRCVYSNPSASSSTAYVRSLEARINELESSLGQESDSLVAQRDADYSLQSPADFGTGKGPGGPVRDRQSILQEMAPGRSSSLSRDLDTESSQNVHLASSHAKSITGNPASESCQTVLENGPAFLGSSSAVGFMTEVYQIFGSRESRTSNAVDGSNSTPRPGPSSWFSHQKGGAASLSLISSEFMIPQRVVADKLLDSYWIGAHPLQPFIHQRTFRERYNRLWGGIAVENHEGASGAYATRDGERLFHCTFNTMLALGCRFWPVSNPDEDKIPPGTEQYFFDQAKKLLNFDLLDTPSIELVQAILLMVQFLQNESLSNRAWVLLGTAIRVAQAVGLHLGLDCESQEKREERSKTWSLCVLLDRMQSMTFGRPMMLGSSDTWPNPQIVDEEFLEVDPAAPDAVQPLGSPAKAAFFVNVLKLSHITADILRLSYSPLFDQSASNQALFDYTSLFKIDQDLELWHEGLPSYLLYGRIEGPSKVTNLFERQAHLLHHRYLHSKILLFRRVVVRLAAKSFARSSTAALRSIEQSMASSCVDICISAAQQLLEAISPHIGTQLVPPAWFTIFLVCTAGTVLAVVLSTPFFREDLSMEQINHIQQCWTLCIECLRDYEKRGVPFALSGLRDLGKLYPIDDSQIRAAFASGKDATWTLNTFSNQFDSGSLVPPQNNDNNSDIHSAEPRHSGLDPSDLWTMTIPDFWWPENGFDTFIELAHSNR